MKILITGSGGFLGSRIVKSLLALGERDLRCQIREGRGIERLRAISREAGVEQVEIVACNLLSPADTDALLQGVDLVIHAAAGTKGAAADMVLNTVVATRNLLDSAVKARTRRIAVVSSFAVYRTEGMTSGALLNEQSPVEPVGLEKGAYAYSKVRQEQLVRQYQSEHGFEQIFIRPGVIYGPGGTSMSSRVGIRALGWFFSLGGACLLPLTHVDNCADAVAIAALRGESGAVFNAVDDDLPTCGAYLKRYKSEVESVRSVPVPYPALLAGSRLLVWYSKTSKGQLPAIFTPYIVRSMYRHLKYSNAALQTIGWRQKVPTGLGVDGLFSHLKK